MTTEDADALLKRMQFTYRTPADIRGNPEAVEERLRIYRNSLQRFDADILDRAWLKAASRHRYPQWPDCPDVVEAAEHFHALAHPKANVDDGWQERVTSREDEYTKRFMQTTQAAVRAREQGYERELKRYVLAAAHVQSQLIEGRKEGVGYESAVLFPGRERDKEAENEFFARAREQAARGCIQVRVPAELVREWKAGASAGRGR
jgi:hypothetical protein